MHHSCLANNRAGCLKTKGSFLKVEEIIFVCLNFLESIIYQKTERRMADYFCHKRRIPIKALKIAVKSKKGFARPD